MTERGASEARHATKIHVIRNDTALPGLMQEINESKNECRFAKGIENISIGFGVEQQLVT
jgi:hypothetical protein